MLNNRISKAVRLAIAFGTASTAVFSASSIAAEEGVDKVECIEVTGSRIKRADLESASPVSIITTEDMKVQGISNISDALQNLTAQSGGLTAAVNNGGNGNATVNLRGMGSSRTLVLVNGRRMIASGTGASSTVDLNAIPFSAVKRIEVLKDGASAVYGSDALAGVVNIIMRDDFEGFELDASYAETGEGDGDEASLSSTFGVSSDKGNVVVNVGFYDRGTVRASDRDYSACPYAESGGERFCAGSGNSLGMNAILDDGRRVQFEPGGNGSSTDTGYHTYVGSGEGNDTYNYSSASYLSTPATRYNVSVLGNYELAGNLNFFAEAYYTNRTSTQQMAPAPINYTYSVDGRSWVLSQNPDVYPFSGLYDFATPGDNVDMLPLRRMSEMGGRVFEQEVNTAQFTTGLEGFIADQYAWNVFYTYGRNSAIDRSKNYINVDKMIASVNENCEGVSVTGSSSDYTVTGNDASAPCINYFGEGALSQSDADYLRYTDQGTSGTEMHHLGASISGDLFEMPSGVVGFAFGLEHREESAFNQPDAFSSSGIGSGNAVQPTSGGYKVDEAYVELVVPLLDDLPMVQSLDLEAALRYFDYDTFGSDTTYKLGLTWRMTDEVMLRSVLSTAFRAPSVSELYGGQSDSFTNYTDPCTGFGGAGFDSRYQTACASDAASGLIPSNGTFAQNSGQLRAVVGGNPDLGPETADTFTVGLVVEPIEGLSFTVDYYDIEVDNVISSVGITTKLDKCYSAGEEGGQGGSFALCEGVVRDATGNFDGTPSLDQNLSTWNLSGVDFNAQYSFDAAGLAWRADWEASYISKWEVQEFAGEPIQDYVGVASSGSGSIPEWKHNVSLRAAGDDWTVSYKVMYVDSLVTESVALFDGDPADYYSPEADSFVSHTLSGTYQLNEHVSLRGGIDNLTDEEPPYYSDYDDANTDTTLYKYIGRNFFVGTTISF